MNKVLLYVIVVSMFVITADAFARNGSLKPEKVLNCYEKSLDHENQGIVASTILNIMKLKTVYPELNYSKTIKKIEELSLKSKSKKIRFSAYIAVNFLKYPNQLEWKLPESYKELDAFFNNCEINFDKPIAQTN